MHPDTNALASLIGSRICHDLISPLGAVNNGIELLELSGTTPSPELALVAESVAHANARIRFFRLAFGLASHQQETGAEEVNSILNALHADERTTINAFPDGHFPRAEVRATMLALLCAEQAVPYGGDILIERNSDQWCIKARSPRLKIDHDHWSLLDGRGASKWPAPSAVQFLILPAAAHDAGLTCSTKFSDEQVEITLRRA